MLGLVLRAHRTWSGAPVSIKAVAVLAMLALLFTVGLTPALAGVGSPFRWK
jgi:hypothetical protein